MKDSDGARVVPLRAGYDEHLIGAKAWRLAQLASTFRVPSGFVVTTNAFLSLGDRTGITDGQLTLPGSAGEYEPPVGTSFSLPIQLVDEIRSAYEAILCSRVAVRSSAVAEDHEDASWAGQLQTLLNVQGMERLLSAVVQCGLSGFDPRALAYARRAGLAPELRVAVLVQALVEAEVSGTMFTQDKETGSTVIESCWGLGTGVGEGAVPTDCFTVDAETGEVQSARIATKFAMIRADGDGTIRRAEVPAERQRARSLSEQQIATLTRMARELEEIFHTPLDVEWALDGSTMWILQVRPVTAAPSHYWCKAPASRPFDWWTRAPVAEALPGLVSPLTWSLCHDSWSAARRAVYGKKPAGREVEFFRLYKQRAFFNSGGHRYLEETQGYSRDAAGIQTTTSATGRYAMLRRKFRRAIRAGRYLALLLTAETQTATGARVARWLVGSSMRKRSDADLVRTLRRVGWLTSRLLRIGALSDEAAFTGADKLRAIHRRWTGTEDGTEGLMMGLRTRSEEMVAALLRIAGAVRSNPHVTAYMGSEQRPSMQGLRALPEARGVVSALEEFLRRFGHRGNHEFEWRRERWQEQPEQVLEIVRRLSTAGKFAHTEAVGASHDRRQQALRKARSLIRGRTRPMHAWLRCLTFVTLLRLVRGLLSSRENCRSTLLVVIAQGRRTVVELGERMANRGSITAPNDVFMLTVDEITDEVNLVHRVARNLPLLTARRRLEEEIATRATIPPALDAKGKPVWTQSGDLAAATARLRGTPIVGGRVRGVARVMERLEEVQRVNAGDILVLPSADPSWTPIFPLAGALVVEVGGPLSHAAIIAREYGLPTVSNIEGAVSIITEGQLLVVDGDLGEVIMLESPQPDPRSATTSDIAERGLGTELPESLLIR